MKARKIIGGLVIAGVAVAAVIAMNYLRAPVTVTLRFQAVVGDQPLHHNQFLYPNPGGQGQYRVRDFLFFLSNIKLVSDEGFYAEPESYHLARFDNEEGVYLVSLEGVPKQVYQHLEFTLGLDAQANGSLVSVGDLDPNGRMAWNWETGYKFVLLEGTLQIDERQVPLVYHVGFNENARSMSFSIAGEGVGANRHAVLGLNVDVAKLFTGATVIDLAALPTVKFDRDDAQALADNYATMID
ncbi:MAG: hypothetical protein ACI9UU_000156 [Candidatus Azotimanducaceae bacterium]|jgi:hypothetical protein